MLQNTKYIRYLCYPLSAFLNKYKDILLMEQQKNFQNFDKETTIHFVAAGSMFAALESMRCKPYLFTFTPESQNAFFEFDQCNWRELELIIKKLIMHGSDVCLCDGIHDQILEILVNGKFSDLFKKSEEPNPTPLYLETKDSAPDIVWRGHFYWKKVESSKIFLKSRFAYGFDFVGWNRKKIRTES